MKKIVYFSLLATFFFINSFPVHGITTEDERAIRQDTIYYEDREISSCHAQSLSNTTLSDSSSIPEPYKEVFSEAAEEYDVDVALLSTVYAVENRSNFPEDPYTHNWPVSPGGAKGPYQFLDGTWDEYGVDANNDGQKDINNFDDASYGAAKYLKSFGAKTGLELGGLEQDFSKNGANKETVAWILKSYNAGPGTYRDNSGTWRTPSRVWVQKKQDEINTYIPLGIKIYQDYADSEQTGSEDECGGLGKTDELTFPVQTTKQEIRQGVQGGTWCYNATKNCHGQYNAADIHVPIGTPVVAAAGGTVIQVRNTSKSLSIRVRGDDGLYYFYQHLTIGSERVSENEAIEEGDTIGEVGDRTAAFNTAPHLHFDMAPERVGISRKCVRNGNCDKEKSLMIDSQPMLVEAFKELPEG